MEGEFGLTLREEDLLPVLQEHELGQLLQPLTREIFLFETYIAGTSSGEESRAAERLAVGDRLTLLREDSRFDDFAILLLNGNGERVGRIPEIDNAIFARLMDAGKQLNAKVSSIAKRSGLTRVLAGIYLIDY